MLIVGENLKTLNKQLNICEERLFDENSLIIEIDDVIFTPINENNSPIKYGHSQVDKHFIKNTITNGEILLKPSGIALACSRSNFDIPNGYFGVVQTKGSLARLFVAATCNDSQIDPGFSGKITLEIINFSPFDIIIPVGSKVAQLYIYKCSTLSKLYDGKYGKSDIPTICIPEYSKK
jgi:dCTP deaminase